MILENSKIYFLINIQGLQLAGKDHHYFFIQYFKNLIQTIYIVKHFFYFNQKQLLCNIEMKDDVYQTEIIS